MSQKSLVPRSSLPSGESTNGTPTPEKRSRTGWRPAFFAGVDPRILNQVSSEWCFYDTLGTAVFGLCCFSGFSASLALGSALQTPALHLWWFGALWTLGLIFCIERLILQVPTTRKRSTFLTSLLFRIALSVLLAFLLSEPLVMRLNESEINTQLERENRIAKQQAFENVQGYYKPRIKATKEQLHGTRHQKKKLEQETREYRRRSGETEFAEGGCGPRCLSFAETADAKQGLLRTAEKRNTRKQPELHQKLDELRDRQREAEEGAAKAVDKGNGFWARVGALSAVMDRRPLMEWELWGLRVLFLFFDIAPLLSLVYYLKRQGPKPYEDLRVAMWHEDALMAMRIREAVGVEEHRIREQSRADKEVTQAEIMLEADRRIVEGGLDGVAGTDRPAASTPIEARNLSDFVREMRPHENEPVTISPELRRGGIIGALGIGALAILAALWTALTHQAVEGMWLVVIALCGVGALAAYTHGFRRAPAWALRAILFTLVVGLTLPLLILLINV